MTYPFFSLAKTRRVAPIDFRAGDISVRVEATAQHGMATIWDADVLIWATSQIIEARDCGIAPSRRLGASPREILTFLRRGTSARDYARLKAALDRLQSTTIATSLRQTSGRRLHRFSLINEWKELADPLGRPLGLEVILADWFYEGISEPTRVLTIDPRYFDLQGGIERWLYRLARKHAGGQTQGWRFDIPYLHRKSGSLARLNDFAIDLRRIALRGRLPGYNIVLVRTFRVEYVLFQPHPTSRVEPRNLPPSPVHNL